MRIVSMAFLIACAPGGAVTQDKLLDDGIIDDTDAAELDSGAVDTAEPSEPSGEPSGEPSNEPTSEPSSDPNEDGDGDGFTPSDGDCDDSNAEVNPDAAESANDLDDDCDGTIDEGTQNYDDDGDGFSEVDGDCDDDNPNVSPGGQEILDDGIDQDCSGADLSCSNTSEVEWFADFPSTGTSSCNWGNDGNLPDTQGQISARREQEAIYTPPAGSAICAIRPAIQSNQGGYYAAFEFDDDAMMVYNDYVLFSTNDELTDPLQSGSWSGKLYDWDLMKGAGLNGFTWEWGNSTASLGSGQFYVSMQNNKMNNLHDISIVNGEIRFMLVTFGDNDNDGSSDGADCSHDGLSFPVEIELAQ